MTNEVGKELNLEVTSVEGRSGSGCHGRCWQVPSAAVWREGTTGSTCWPACLSTCASWQTPSLLPLVFFSNEYKTASLGETINMLILFVSYNTIWCFGIYRQQNQCSVPCGTDITLISRFLNNASNGTEYRPLYSGSALK